MKIADGEGPSPNAAGDGHIAPALGGFGPGADTPPVPATLANIGGQLVAAAMSMQGSEMPPTAAQLEACKKQESEYTALMAKWSALKAGVSAPGKTATASK